MKTKNKNITPATVNCGKFKANQHGGILAPLAAALIGLCTVAGTVQAADNNWTGGTDAQWDAPTNWSQNAKPIASDAANFPSAIPGTGATVTLNTGEVADTLGFGNSYTLTGGNLALTSGTVDVAPTFTATINSALIGSAVLTKNNTGTLTLGGANTYSGNTVIEGGSVSVTGSIGNADQVYVGVSNSDTSLTVSSGGSVADVSGSIGVGTGSANNVATVTGAGTAWTNSGNLNVGYEGDHNTLNIQSGGAVSANYTNIGGFSTATNNALNISGAGSSLTNAHDLFVGYGGDTNTLSIGGQTQASNVNGFVGYAATADNNAVSVSGTNSLWQNAGALQIGYDGSGNTLTISAGGKVTVNGASQDALISSNVGADANRLTVTGTGSEFSNQSTLYIGRDGNNNELEVLNGGLASSKNVRIGGGTGSVGSPTGNSATVDGAGSAWNISGTLRVGSNGTNSALDISNGGTVNVTGNSFLGYSATSTGNRVNISGAGSQLTANDLIVGRDGGNNAVIVETGGNLTATLVTLGQSGSLQIGTGAAAGTVNVPTITSPAPDSFVAFNHNQSSYNFGSNLEGSLNVQQNGTGETVLSGNNTYTGSTTISSGTLSLAAATNNIASSSLISVSAGAKFNVTQVTGGFELANGQTLNGNGNVVGRFTTLAGSTIAPATIGTIGTLGFDNDLVLGGNLKIDVSGALNDLIKVAGNLQLGANSILDFNGIGPLTASTFIFAEYGNGLPNPPGSFGSVNGLAVSYIIDYNYQGLNQIALVIPEPSTLSLMGIAGLGFGMARRRKVKA